MTCRHVGCTYPQGECAGLCASDFARRTTSDTEYADLLARLNAMPGKTQRSLTRAQERQHLIEDMLVLNGEATW